MACVVNEWWIHRAQVLLMQTSRSASIKTLKYQASSGSYLPDEYMKSDASSGSYIPDSSEEEDLLLEFFYRWKFKEPLLVRGHWVRVLPTVRE